MPAEQTEYARRWLVVAPEASKLCKAVSLSTIVYVLVEIPLRVLPMLYLTPSPDTDDTAIDQTAFVATQYLCKLFKALWLEELCYHTLNLCGSSWP